jgi:hypothetical protein
VIATMLILNNQPMRNLPDLGGMFLQLRLRDKLEEVYPESLLGFAIHNALDNKVKLGDICEMVLSQYNDCPHVVLNVVPQDTIDLMAKIYYRYE